MLMDTAAKSLLISAGTVLQMNCTSLKIPFMVSELFALPLSSGFPVSCGASAINWIQYQNFHLEFLLSRLNSVHIVLVEQFFMG